MVYLEEVETVLKRNRLLFDRTYSRGYLGRSDTKRLTYEELWKTTVSSAAFDFRLIDNSLLDFSISQYGDMQPRFAYYPSPYIYPSLHDYLIQEGFDLGSKEFHEASSACAEEYMEQLANAPINPNPMTIRYDKQTDSYSEAIHPENHMHLGLNNDIRIGCGNNLSPLDFTHFVIRQVYPQYWKVYSAKHEASIRQRISNKPSLHSRNFGNIDELELYLKYLP
ncbi:DUF2290 domain-containing protein [Deinococcus sp. 23YEL01]|uniref:DUF2290 domain-containing protein n=1 Tax=Deinococcus sp. 23YEL01 TaxID=2745871 RepID=UPI001E52B9D1|nr:DUF2290 domain-containing protein [Deinococcus sp. 23YEL01]MCD0169117.1 DUF2290 domain-containing protein [Deinococcus sp. 23YEL01]